MGKDVIIACDFSSSEETLRFLDKTGRKETICEDRYGAFLCRKALIS